ELGLEFMLTRTITDPDHVRDEIDRYLGWPGQAPAYKIGERLWLAAREDARRRAGDAFDVKDFHTKALRLGGMGLDTLREQLAAQYEWKHPGHVRGDRMRRSATRRGRGSNRPEPPGQLGSSPTDHGPAGRCPTPVSPRPKGAVLSG